MSSGLQLNEQPSLLFDEAGLKSVEAIMASCAADHDGDLLSRMLGHHLAAGGKRLRARLALAAASALGFSRYDATGWAAAVEILHNASLIHDDIQDGDTVRRGHPTVWSRFGVSQAINAGDLGLMLPFKLVSDIQAEPSIQMALVRLVSQEAINTVAGQSNALTLLPDACFERERYFACVVRTTGAFFSLPVEGAALLSGLSEIEARRLGESFLKLGILFQLQDDVLDLYGDKGRDIRGADLREGKVSALVIEHLAHCPKDHDWLLGLLRRSRAQTSTGDIERAIETFRVSGALKRCMDRINDIANSINEDSYLSRFPELHDLARECVEVVLEPIEGMV